MLYASGDQHGLPEEPAPATPPVNDYARTKRAAGALTAAHPGAWAILRPRAVYGVADRVLFPRIARAARLRLLPHFRQEIPAQGDLVSFDTLVRQVARAVEGEAHGIFHLIDPSPDRSPRHRCPGPARPARPRADRVPRRCAQGRRSARGALAADRLVGAPADRLRDRGLHRAKTFDDRRARAHLGPPDVPTEVAVDRFRHWWQDGARLDDPAMGQVGKDP